MLWLHAVHLPPFAWPQRSSSVHLPPMQCGRFHVLAEFEGNKRSCRGQLEKQALRRRLARRAAANQPPGGAEQTGSQSNCCSGSSGAGRGGERAALLQCEARAEQLFQAVEARAAAAAVASTPLLPWRSGAVLSHPAAAAESHRHATVEQLVASTQQRQAAAEQLAAAEQQQRAAAEQLAALLLYQQPATIPAQRLEGHSLPAQQPQQLLQQHGSDLSHHSLIALATAASAGTAALPSPAAPITPATAEDPVPASQQPPAAALPPAMGQPSLSPLLQALLGLAPSLPQPQLPPPLLLPSPPQQLPPPPPPLPLVPPLVPPHLPPQLPAQQSGAGPYAQQLISHLVALDQQRLIEQRRAQRSEDDLAALVRAVVQFLTTLSGGSLEPPPR